MREKVTLGKIWGIIYPGLIYMLSIQVVAFIVVFILSIVLTINEPTLSEEIIADKVDAGITSQLMMIQLTAGIVTAPLLMFFMNRDRQRDKLNGRLKRYKMVSPLKFLLIIPFALFVMYAGNAFLSALQTIFPSLVDSAYLEAQEYLWGCSITIQILEVVIIGPIVEELIFRGLIYNRIKRMTKIIPAAIISALLFGIFHGNFLQGIYGFIFGLATVFVYEKYKTMAALILFHMSGNLISVILQYVTNNTGVDTQAQLPVVVEVIYMLIMSVIAGSLAFGAGTVIKATVNPKER